MDSCELCLQCGNHHNGACSSEVTYFFWFPQSSKNCPINVEIVGEWQKWQHHQQMEREVDEKGEIYFQIAIGIPVGYFEYKYVVDGQWKHNKSSPYVADPYGGYNNYIEVLPKTAVFEYNPRQDIKISSGITAQGLKIVGSWDKWKSQTKMDRVYNNLKGCEENLVYLQLVPNKYYEFKFKLKNQYLIDENYPTYTNQQGTTNNRIFVKDIMSTPTGWRTNKSTSNSSSVTCRKFQWQKILVDSDVSFHKQILEGHSLCQIGQYLYIFGGRLKHDFTNRLSKVSLHHLNTIISEEILPIERAFHNVAAYGNKMIIFGGHNWEILQDYAVYNTIDEAWQTPPIIGGKFPQKRQNQSCVLYENLLVFFGGYACSADIQFQLAFNDINVLDLRQMRWIDQQLMKVEGIRPQKRYSHTATLLNSIMYIFAGSGVASDSRQQINFNDLWAMNLQNVSNLQWNHIKPKGKPPKQRQGHSCNAIQQFLIVFGGTNYKKQLFNDVIVFDTQKIEWIYPLIHNPVYEPSPRAFHGSTSVNNQYIVLFGGKTNSYLTTSMYVLKPKDTSKAFLDIEEDEQQYEESLSPKISSTKKKRLKTEDPINLQPTQ